MSAINDFINGIVGFAGNAANDVVGIGRGLYNLPGEVTNAAQHNQLPQFAGQMAKGIAQSYNEDLGEPIDQNGNINTRNLIGTGLYGINPALAYQVNPKPAQHFYQHPVDTALDIAGAASAVKGLTGLAKAGTLPEAGEGGLPPLRQMDTPNVSDAVAKTYMRGYTVPTGLKVNPVETGKWMVNDNPNLGKIQDFLNTTEQLKRNVLTGASRNGQVVNIGSSIDDAIDSINKIPELAESPKKLAAYNNELRMMAPESKLSRMPLKLGGTTQALKGADPLDTYDAIKNIENRGYTYLKSAKDAYGNVRDWEKENVGRAYVDAASDIEALLDKAVGTGIDNIQAFTQDPQLLQQVKSFSGPVADRLANNVQNWSDLRALQKPYVDMGKIMDYTSKAGNTPFSNLAGSITKAGPVAAGVALGNTLGGPTGAVLGGIGGAVAEPFIEAGVNKVLPGLAQGVATGLPKIGTGAKALGSTAVGAGVLANAVENQSNTDNEQQHAQGIHTGDNGITSNTISQPGGVNMPPELQSYQRDPKTGEYQLPTSLAQTPINNLYTYKQFQKDTSGLDLFNPVDKSTYDKLLTRYNQSQDIAKEYIQQHPVTGDERAFVNNDGPQANSVLNQLYHQFQQLPPNILNANKTLADLRSYNDPQFAKLVTAVDTMKGYVPELLKLGIPQNEINDALPTISDSPAEAMTKLDYFQKLIVNKYDNLYGPATFSSQALPGVPTDTFSTSPVGNYNTSQGLPSVTDNGLPPITGGGNDQALPAGLKNQYPLLPIGGSP